MCFLSSQTRWSWQIKRACTSKVFLRTSKAVDCVCLCKQDVQEGQSFIQHAKCPPVRQCLVPKLTAVCERYLDCCCKEQGKEALDYKKDNQTRRQEKLGASQDKSKLSHSNDWCAKTGSNTSPPNENGTLLDTPLKSAKPRPS